MHRVELKDEKGNHISHLPPPVPNAPCGVERIFHNMMGNTKTKVPNAPCGVERRLGSRNGLTPVGFLMHRVELKGG